MLRTCLYPGCSNQYLPAIKYHPACRLHYNRLYYGFLADWYAERFLFAEYVQPEWPVARTLRIVLSKQRSTYRHLIVFTGRSYLFVQYSIQLQHSLPSSYMLLFDTVPTPDDWPSAPHSLWFFRHHLFNNIYED